MDSIEKTVKAHGNSARVLVPKSWMGKRVKVFLLESEELPYLLKQKVVGGHRLTVVWVSGEIAIVRQEQLVNNKWTTAGANWYTKEQIINEVKDVEGETGKCRKEVIGETGDVVYVAKDELGLEYYL
jgi:hypothetical protein